MNTRESTTAADDRPRHPGDADINVRAVLGFAAGLVVTALTVHVAVWLLFRYFDGRETTRTHPTYPLAIGREDRLPPEPRLQPNPRDNLLPRDALRALRAHEDDLLSTYGWIDKPAGVVRIPIEEAIRITAQRGLPSRPGKGAP